MNNININKLIDTHAHLDFPDLYPRIDEVIANAKLNDVYKIITISTNLAKIDKIIKISEDKSQVFFTVGVHPNEVDKDKNYLNYDLIKKISEHPKCVGIGEGGLDYHYGLGSKSNQIASFITQINVARDTNLPLVIHSRDADKDMIEILTSEHKNGEFKAILHCFSSGEKLIASDSSETGSIIENSSNADLTISDITTHTFADARQIFMDDNDTGQDFTADLVLTETSTTRVGKIVLNGTDANSTDQNDDVQLEDASGNIERESGKNMFSLILLGKLDCT